MKLNAQLLYFNYEIKLYRNWITSTFTFYFQVMPKEIKYVNYFGSPTALKTRRIV
jgi:hypothetical protein